MIFEYVSHIQILNGGTQMPFSFVPKELTEPLQLIVRKKYAQLIICFEKPIHHAYENAFVM